MLFHNSYCFSTNCGISYHVGETSTRSKTTWPSFNESAYSRTVEDFCLFAKSVFSESLFFPTNVCLLISPTAPEECRARSITNDTSSNVESETSGSPEPPAMNLITDATALIAETPPVDDSRPDKEDPRGSHPPSELLAPVDVPLSDDHADDTSPNLPLSEPLFQPVPHSTRLSVNESDPSPSSEVHPTPSVVTSSAASIA